MINLLLFEEIFGVVLLFVKKDSSEQMIHSVGETKVK